MDDLVGLGGKITRFRVHATADTSSDCTNSVYVEESTSYMVPSVYLSAYRHCPTTLAEWLEERLYITTGFIGR